MPLCMPQRSVDIAPGAGVVDHDHARDGDATQDIQRKKAAALLPRFDSIHYL